MNCSAISSELTVYADGTLDEPSVLAVQAHLAECPLCRYKLAELRGLVLDLRRLRSSEPPAKLTVRLRQAVREEIKLRNSSWLPFSTEDRSWIRQFVMPYTVGTLASLMIGFTVLTMMFSGIRDRNALVSAPRHTDETVMIASNRDPFGNTDDLVSPAEFARTRLDVSRESPSVNPQGALVALTRSLVRGEMRDDEVVVVADVFGNGLAKVAEVVEPSRDRRAVADLEKALASNDPQYAPFLAADVDNRPGSMRVVLKFQSVDVPTGKRRR